MTKKVRNEFAVRSCNYKKTGVSPYSLVGYTCVGRRANYVLERQEIETKWFEGFLGNQMVGLFA
jgi:hypothetical protein